MGIESTRYRAGATRAAPTVVLVKPVGQPKLRRLIYGTTLSMRLGLRHASLGARLLDNASSVPVSQSGK